MPSLDLEKQLTFYGSYHHNQVNKGIHIFFVPVILASAITLGTNTPALIDLPYLPLNFGAIAAFVYCFLYILMEPVAGGMITPLIFAGAAYGNHLTKTYGAEANKWALILHISSWIAQFVGHGKFEGRKPALLDNLFQSLFLAPFFVWFEILFTFGYRPELRARVEAAVTQEVAKYRASKAAKSNIPLKDLNGNGKALNGGAY